MNLKSKKLLRYGIGESIYYVLPLEEKENEHLLRK
jgi:hypothetical protein